MCVPTEVSIDLVARFIYEHCNWQFKVNAQDPADILAEITQGIHEEVCFINAYVQTWRGSCALRRDPDKEVQSETSRMAQELLWPWPTIAVEPTPESDDARFVKAFPLELPTGTGDLRQPRMRNDFHAADWVQHLLRYHTGHFLNPVRASHCLGAL